MRFSIAVLALSTLAAAGPLPPMSNTTLDLGLITQVSTLQPPSAQKKKEEEEEENN